MKKKNKLIIYSTFLLALLLIAVPSTYKVVKKHNERLLKTTIKKIKETAKNCYYTDSCIHNEITLQELYEKTGLETMNNPITKRIYNPNSYVDVANNFEFIELKE